MGFRERCAVNLAPIFLRLALGLTFIWAGAAKVFDEAPVRGEDAAALANLGVLAAAPKAPAVPAATPTPAPTPASAPASAPEPAKPAGGPPALMQLVPQASPAAGYTAADFPGDVNVRALHKSLTLRLLAASHPAEGRMPLWPPRLGEGKWPVYAAWAAALTELVGGCWLVLGLFTRIAALGLTGVMVGAMWLTQFGPAIQSGNTYLGFIPRQAAFAVNECGIPVFAMLWWQVALLGGALALLFAGSGALAIDRALFGGGAPSKPE